jgi:hypothetical protein
LLSGNRYSPWWRRCHSRVENMHVENQGWEFFRYPLWGYFYRTLPELRHSRVDLWLQWHGLRE